MPRDGSSGGLRRSDRPRKAKSSKPQPSQKRLGARFKKLKKAGAKGKEFRAEADKKGGKKSTKLAAFKGKGTRKDFAGTAQAIGQQFAGERRKKDRRKAGDSGTSANTLGDNRGPRNRRGETAREAKARRNVPSKSGRKRSERGKGFKKTGPRADRRKLRRAERKAKNKAAGTRETPAQQKKRLNKGKSTSASSVARGMGAAAAKRSAPAKKRERRSREGRS